jgi:hypothetical protein
MTSGNECGPKNLRDKTARGENDDRKISEEVLARLGSLVRHHLQSKQFVARHKAVHAIHWRGGGGF